MRTVKRNRFLAGVGAIGAGAFLWAASAAADVTSDRSAAILVFPKLVFNSAANVDTEIQLSNTAAQFVNLRCFYVNANSHCSNDAFQVCNTIGDCDIGGLCVPGWVEIDFQIELTPYQPLIWKLSDGMPVLPLGLAGVQRGNIPPANEDPFFGELKCIQVDANDEPVDRNDLKGEVSIVTVDDGLLDARAYNAVGIQAIPGAVNPDNVLVLGEEYNGCPNILILDHFFEDAVEPINGDHVRTHVTLVPCSQDFLLQRTFDTTVQFLVYNEFEQRFSSSRKVNCWKEFDLCSLDNPRADRPLFGPDSRDPTFGSCDRSIFSAFVQGTLVGQTRFRGVDGGSELYGNGLIGVAEEFHRTASGDLATVRGTNAFNIHQSGRRARPDRIILP